MDPEMFPDLLFYVRNSRSPKIWKKKSKNGSGKNDSQNYIFMSEVIPIIFIPVFPIRAM